MNSMQRMIAAATGLLALAATPPALGENVVYTFQGGRHGFRPSGLINVGGTLYGVASGVLGIVFKLDPATGAEAVVYRFRGGSDGAAPMRLTNVHATLYGPAKSGGGAGFGVVFKLDPATGAEAVVYRFRGHRDGFAPTADLINVGGTLYGSTEFGGIGSGSLSHGTVFKIDLATEVETVLHRFRGGSDGDHSYARLINVGGMLYGTTGAGGTGCGGGGCGTVFRIDPVTGEEAVIYRFLGGSDGLAPMGGLVNVGGLIYGTTHGDGTSSHGTVFKIDLATGSETVVYRFQGGSDGDGPTRELIDVRGMLYGTTEFGGSCGSGGLGTVFKLDPATGVESVVHCFQGGSDGIRPNSRLIYVADILYGTTYEGGGGTLCTNGCGTVFKLKP
jgi:uncharacterized repeat protein (TIGR03803 family)